MEAVSSANQGVGIELLQAARDGNLDNVKNIIKQQSKEIINCINEIGQTPLHLASRNQHLNIVKELIVEGANINALDQKCRSPLHAAMSLDICMGSENLQVVQYLVDHGADLTIQDADGLTPIHHASKSGRVQILKWLMDHDPYGYLPPSYSPRGKNNNNTTPTTDTTDCKTVCSRTLRYIWVGCAYPFLEIVASVVCCLPAWQECADITGAHTRLLPGIGEQR